MSKAETTANTGELLDNIPEELRQHPAERLRDVSRTPSPQPSGRADLRLVSPAPSDPERWKQLMNHLFICEEDELFRWVRSVRAAVEAST